MRVGMANSAAAVDAELVSAASFPCPDDVARRRLANARAYHAGVLTAAVLVLSSAAILEVQGSSGVALWGWQLPEICWWRSMLGRNCAGCGLTRSLVSLVHGQWAAAWQLHPAGVLLAPVILAQLPFRAWQLARIARQRAPVASRCLTASGILFVCLPLLVCAVQHVAAWCIALTA